MQEVIEFFQGLFSTDRWPPRWKCGYWSGFHGWLYIISDLMIWLAYFLIPLIILNYFKTKRTAIRFSRVYLLFAAFILLCGTTHFVDAVMFWEPMYRFNALVRFVTGVVSLFTAYQLFIHLPEMFRLRTSLELEQEIMRREKVESELAEANTRLSAFASIASHDLQEPVRKIHTFASLLYSRNKETFDEPSRVNTEKIISSSVRMHDLINDILTLSSITEQVELSPVYPADAVRQSLDNLELKINEKGAVIKVGELPVVRGNVAYLTQLFTNLISNSIKFTERRAEVSISGTKTADGVDIAVSDNGIGIEPEYFDRIFEAFERLHSRSTYEGTGMGLAICKRIMEAHLGTITVSSEPGKGTTFTMHFPPPGADNTIAAGAGM